MTNVNKIWELNTLMFLEVTLKLSCNAVKYNIEYYVVNLFDLFVVLRRVQQRGSYCDG